jgi:hypothetical protein
MPLKQPTTNSHYSIKGQTTIALRLGSLKSSKRELATTTPGRHIRNETYKHILFCHTLFFDRAVYTCNC